MKLYSYWRSTAAYRVRIALGLKGLEYEYVPINLVKDGGEQKQAEYRSINPQGLVPLLEDQGANIAQSLAIIRYLDRKYPDYPLYPEGPLLAAEVETFVLGICCDIHPLNNLRVLKYLETDLEINLEQRMTWYHHWLREGFDAIEQTLTKQDTAYCFSDKPTVADICLVAQMYNAKRFNFELSGYPEMNRINELCLNQEAFQEAIPENQPDAD